MTGVLFYAGTALVAGATVYAFAAALVPYPGRRRQGAALPAPGELAVTVLKPLCGAEPHLEENLAELCRQDAGVVQILCGVRDGNDGAVAVVRRLQQRFPHVDLELVVDPRVHGTNLKVSNLINLAAHARHELLVVADSDIGVRADYLRQVTAPLADPSVGIVTCLYRARATGGFWSRLGAQFIDGWFAPSVCVAHALGNRDFGFGATLALTRTTLARIGGFAAVANKLADDFWVAQRVRDLGLATVVPPYWVVTDVTEDRARSLWLRELRWMRTIRSLNPLGFFFSFITFTTPALALGLLLAPAPRLALLALAGLGARAAVQYRRFDGAEAPAGALWLVPLRELMLAAEWAVALFGRSVRWRSETLTLKDPLAASDAASPSLPSPSPR